MKSEVKDKLNEDKYMVKNKTDLNLQPKKYLSNEDELKEVLQKGKQLSVPDQRTK